MTPDQLALIETSAQIADDQRRPFAETFYGHLFETAPDVRPLFSADLEGQYEKLVDEVAFLAGAARDLDRFIDRAHDLGRRHGEYGVTESMFEPVRTSLLIALESVAGPTWTPAHESAWSSLFRLISQVMLEGASADLFRTS